MSIQAHVQLKLEKQHCPWKDKKPLTYKKGAFVLKKHFSVFDL